MKNFILKISAAGNRFFFIDKLYMPSSQMAGWEENSFQTNKSFEDFLSLEKKTKIEREEFLKDFFERIPEDEGKSADGLVIFKKEDEFLFYNKDGSQALMCGNAVCCIAHFLGEKGRDLKKFSLNGSEVQVEEGGVLLKKKEEALEIKKPFPFYFIDTGVPHGVIPLENLNFEDLEELKSQALKIRHLNIKNYKEGMNVTFYEKLEKNKIKALSFERGVEDFTLACGTGALASASVYNKSSKEDLPQVVVSMPGGDLRVSFKKGFFHLFSPVKKGF